MRFLDERIENSRNFANKIWNASRFVIMNLEKGGCPDSVDVQDLAIADKWILSRANSLAREVTENMDKFELGIAVQKVYDFLWDEFCDWYIEIVKLRLRADATPESKNAALWTLRTVLTEALKLLHPYMPFVTEEIYTTLLPDEETIMTAPWPVAKEEWKDQEAERLVAEFQELVRGIRNMRMERHVEASVRTDVIIVGKDEKAAESFKAFLDDTAGAAGLLFASGISVGSDASAAPSDAVTITLADITAYIPMDELVDREKEAARLGAEREKTLKEIKRAEGMLGNPGFLSKAPAAKIEAEKEKLEKHRAVLAQLEAQLARL